MHLDLGYRGQPSQAHCDFPTCCVFLTLPLKYPPDANGYKTGGGTKKLTWMRLEEDTLLLNVLDWIRVGTR